MADPSNPEYFTRASIASVGIASGMIWMAANTIHAIFGVAQKYTAFVGGLLIAYVYLIMKGAAEPLDYLIAFFNACLLYCTAMGMNNVGGTITGGAAKRTLAAPAQVSKPTFFARLLASFSTRWL